MCVIYWFVGERVLSVLGTNLCGETGMCFRYPFVGESGLCLSTDLWAREVCVLGTGLWEK